ncbi:MAG: cell division protein FtsL [Candidatus Riflebacteria bacterium]|nr:cell division protein FtsL [Candidatus Riflebacteria bacterium]
MKKSTITFNNQNWRPEPIDQDGKKRRLIRLYMTAIILLSLMFTMYVWQSTKIVEVKWRLQELSKKTSGLESNIAVLKASISKLQSISRIEKLAREDLGMIFPKQLCFIPMSDYYKVNGN